MRISFCLLSLPLVLAVSASVCGKPVTIDLTGRVHLSEIDEFAGDEFAAGSFSYDTAAK